MRHSHHAPDSLSTQASLTALAGWAPSRRGFLGSLLVAASATAVTGTAAALVVQSTPPIPAGVSPRMAALIADFERLSTALDAAERSDVPHVWDRAAEAREPVLADLVFEQPATLADFAAKMTTLSRFMAEEDTDLFAFHRLAEDAVALAEAK
jgi:hypothetical protein